MSLFIQQVVNGIGVGCLYALVALGYSMVYGVLRMVNFAHGELFMLGPMFAIVLLRASGVVRGHLNLISGTLTGSRMAMVLAMCFVGGAAFSAVAGLLMERIAYRPLRKGIAATGIISSLGVSLTMQNAAMLVFGRAQKGFPSILPVKHYRLAGATFSNMQVFIIALTFALVLVLSYLINRTYVGRCFRAVALDRCMSGLMGVNVNQVISFVFVLGPALGAASGVLFAMSYGQVYYLMGGNIGIKGWIAAIIGGIGNMWGAVLGGLLLGTLEVVGAGYLPLITKGALGSEYRHIFSFIALILFLVFRPQGLFGRKGGS
ncbi:MAG TPA: branched-chain amino acid ABC transporter permease [Anaerolineae bacterium]|nr:branched-chain amino acid ABC transporter permease [Anaerolineae bacterium]